MDLLKKEYTGITYISGPLLFVENAKDLAYGAIVDIKDGTGRVRGGQVIEVSEEYAVIQVFEETTGLDLATTSVSLVEAGVGVSILPASVEKLGWRGVRYRPIPSASAETRIAAAWRTDRVRPVLAAFMEVVRESTRSTPTRP